jgi:ribonuclease J
VAAANSDWFLRHRKPIEIGPSTITPFLNDHTALDVYSMLVEAGRRLYYTGDFGAHGRKRGIFDQLLREPPLVEVLLTEEQTSARASIDTARAEYRLDTYVYDCR